MYIIYVPFYLISMKKIFQFEQAHIVKSKNFYQTKVNSYTILVIVVYINLIEDCSIFNI